MIQPERITSLNERPAREGGYVLYWMQQSQRADCNHALEHAVREANRLGLPPLVGFGLTDAFPNATLRHYRFMLDGLRETAAALERRGIRLVVRFGSPDEVALQLARDAALLVCDRGYLRVQRQWRRSVAEKAPCPVVQVESDAVVPVEAASDHEEYAARTLRPKLHRLLDRYLVELRPVKPKHPSAGLGGEGLDLSDPEAVLSGMAIDRGVPPSKRFAGGAGHARKRLREFIDGALAGYEEASNRPELNATSHLSPYLHFGQISPLDIALQVLDARVPQAAQEAFLEQLIVRRELSLNFTHYNDAYDQFTCVPDWAVETLDAHRKDRREYRYTREQWEAADTHDPYWNAAQTEMVRSGFMHNYMRMYWGKKLIEWSATPEAAFETMLALNNKYELDGRDPNGFTGVVWCFGKHDRAWTERRVLGKLRYMNDRGLERKFDMRAYIDRVNTLPEG